MSSVESAAVDPKEFRRAVGRFLTGVTITTVRDPEGRPHGLTANSFTSVSLAPPLILLCIDTRARLLDHFMQTAYFAVNILSEQQKDLSNQFAKPNIDRFDGVEWMEGRFGSPLLPGSLAHLECRLVQSHEAGDHIILIGEVLQLSHCDGGPLCYFSGAYRHIAQHP
ncbi:MAG: flavin reductase family protein [Bryobacteraceae bacterium]